MLTKTGADYDILKLLLGYGADCNESAATGPPLHLAVDQGLIPVQLLLKHGADVTAVDARSGETALHRAAGNSQIDVLQCILDQGVDIQRSDKKGWPTQRCCSI